jgi:hypothetical protein
LELVTQSLLEVKEMVKEVPALIRLEGKVLAWEVKEPPKVVLASWVTEELVQLSEVLVKELVGTV